MDFYLKAVIIVILVVGVTFIIKRWILSPVKINLTLKYPTDIHLTTLEEHPPEDVDGRDWVKTERARLRDAAATRMFKDEVDTKDST